jgi:hypothetical protein
MENDNSSHIFLTVRAGLISRFLPLLSKGFRVVARTGCSIKNLLCQQLGIQENYLEEKIQTIFLNGKAIDDLNAPVIQDGSILSLSAAMPGLAGATLRRGGHLAAMRAQISHKKEATTGQDQTGTVTLKLFNLTARDIGPFFLKQGIWISGSDLEEIFDKFGQDIQAGFRLAEVNNKKITATGFLQLDWKKKAVFLVVKAAQN